MTELYITNNLVYQRMAYYHQDSLSIATRKILAQLIAEVISINITIEYFRTSISDIPSTDSLGLFRYLDKQQKGFIVFRDIQRVMGTKHTKLLTYAFSWIDIRKVGEVSRFQFASFLMPRQNLQLRQKSMKNLQQRNGALQVSPQLSIQVGLFQKMMVQIMNKQMKAIQIRHSLVSSKDYTLKAAYSALTHGDRSWICTDDILKFMTNYGFQIQVNDAISTTQAFSSEQSGKLSISDFKWMVQGFQNKQKSYLSIIKTSNLKKPSKKPIIQQKSLQKFIEQKKGIVCQKDKEFNRLMGKIKQIERRQKTKQKRLQKSQRTSLQNARREMQMQISSLKLKRQKESIKRAQQRQQKIIRFQLQTDFQAILFKTKQLQEQGEKFKRLNNRLKIQGDTLINMDNTEPLSYFRGRSNSLSKKDNKRYLSGHSTSFIEDIQNQSCRKAIQKHINASCLYLQQGKQMHSFILSERERVRKHIIANKQNMSQNSKKTAGLELISRNEQSKLANSLDQQQHAQNPSSWAKQANIFSPLTL